MTIGVYYNRTPRPDAEYGVMYQEHPQFRFFLSEFIQTAEELGHQAVLICKESSHKENKTFSYYWEADREHAGFFKKVDAPIDVDVLYDKGYFRKAAPLPIINVPELAWLGRDKQRQAQLFGQYMPTVHAVGSKEDLEAGIALLDTQLAVLKPNNRNGGIGVVVCEKDKLLEQDIAFESNTYVLQPFIDTSQGIKDVVKGTHDFRAYIMNGSVVLYAVRQPKQGSYVANTSQGGTIQFIDVGAFLDEELAVIIKEVDAYFEQFGSRYYSLDFLKDRDKWYLLEVNDRPGIPAKSQSPLVEPFHKKLLDCILSTTSNPINKTALKG